MFALVGVFVAVRVGVFDAVGVLVPVDVGVGLGGGLQLPEIMAVDESPPPLTGYTA